MSVSWDLNGKRVRGPSWGELVEEAARQIGFEDISLLRARGGDLQILEYYKLRKHNLGELRNWLVRSINPPDEALKDSPIHAALSLLKKCPHIYTTNYDDFIERALKLHGRECQVVAIEAHVKHVHLTSELCQVVKFHGDLNFPEGMVVTETDYQKRLAFTSPMDFRFRADVLNRALVFIGYSFTDHNIAYLFQLVNWYLGALPDTEAGRRAYIVVSDPSDFERRLFAARNMTVIPIRGKAQTEDVAQLLSEMGGS